MGQRGSDRLVGEGGRDIVEGWEGSDRLIGGGGADLFVDGPLDDTSKDEILSGGDSDDAFFVDNVTATKNIVSCGDGFDRFAADAKDQVAAGCERIRRGPNAGVNLNGSSRTEIW
jgi:Ca2+-binding RTX toxin-like protein